MKHSDRTLALSPRPLAVMLRAEALIIPLVWRRPEIALLAGVAVVSANTWLEASILGSRPLAARVRRLLVTSWPTPMAAAILTLANASWARPLPVDGWGFDPPRLSIVAYWLLAIWSMVIGWRVAGALIEWLFAKYWPGAAEPISCTERPHPPARDDLEADERL